jgi:hypothetical protein
LSTSACANGTSWNSAAIRITSRRRFPEGYWPETSEPPLPESWDRSIAQIKLDLDAMKALVSSS